MISLTNPSLTSLLTGESMPSIPFHAPKQLFHPHLLLGLQPFPGIFVLMFSQPPKAPLKEPLQRSRGFPEPAGTAWMIESYFAALRVHPAVRDERGATAPPQRVAAVRFPGFPWFPRFAWRERWVMFWLRHSGASPPSIGRWLQNKGIEHLKNVQGV